MDNSLDSIDSNNPVEDERAQDRTDQETETAESTPVAGLEDPKTTELSSEFVGRWTTLISTTNWEKGRIIQDWREALMGSEAPASSYSDEAWSQRVGGVTAQHVGRLRRVYERFGGSFNTYPKLYWSHFLAALDWDDAEMYLEGASQSGWSVSQMRRTRWKAEGGDPTSEPKEAELRSTSDDEDFVPLSEVDESTGVEDAPRGVGEAGPRYDDPDFGDENEISAASVDEDEEMPWDDVADSDGEPSESPFAKLPSLPVDLAEALEQFKLAIIRHRADSWAEVSRDDVLKALDALKAFAAL